MEYRYFTIGEGTYVGREAILTAWDIYNDVHFRPKVIIGKDCGLNDYIHLSCINMIEIGDGVLTGRWVTISDNSHGASNEIMNGENPHKRNLYSKGPIIIEDNVWIGDKVTILANVRIGKNSIIGANSVVTKDIPSNSVACGNPAKIVKQFLS